MPRPCAVVEILRAAVRKCRRSGRRTERNRGTGRRPSGDRKCRRNGRRVDARNAAAARPMAPLPKPRAERSRGGGMATHRRQRRLLAAQAAQPGRPAAAHDGSQVRHGRRPCVGRGTPPTSLSPPPRRRLRGLRRSRCRAGHASPAVLVDGRRRRILPPPRQAAAGRGQAINSPAHCAAAWQERPLKSGAAA